MSGLSEILRQELLQVPFPNLPTFLSKNHVPGRNPSGIPGREGWVHNELRGRPVLFRFMHHSFHGLGRAIVLRNHSLQRNSNLRRCFFQCLLHRMTLVPCERPACLIHYHAKRRRPARRKHADNPPDRPAHHSHALRVRVWQRLEELHHRQHIVGFFLHTRHESWPTIFSDRFAKDRKSTRLNSSHGYISYAVFCLKKKKYQSSCPPGAWSVLASYLGCAWTTAVVRQR